MSAFEKIDGEVGRQDKLWGDSNTNIPDDRWMEILTDEYNDLKWAVRTCAEVPNHTIEKELTQLAAVAARWLGAKS